MARIRVRPERGARSRFFSTSTTAIPAVGGAVGHDAGGHVANGLPGVDGGTATMRDGIHELVDEVRMRAAMPAIPLRDVAAVCPGRFTQSFPVRRLCMGDERGMHFGRQ